MHPSPLKIIIVDDELMVGRSLGISLDRVDDFDVLCLASSGQEAIDMVKKNEIDIAIVDVSMPGLDGYETTRRLCEMIPDFPVIGLSGLHDRETANCMFAAGARGFVTKAVDLNELIEALRTVSSGGTYLSPKTEKPSTKRQRIEQHEIDVQKLKSLTSRQREVLELLLEGRSNREIAEELGLSVKAIESRRTKMMEKLDARSMIDIVKLAIRTGLTPLQEELTSSIVDGLKIVPDA